MNDATVPEMFTWSLGVAGIITFAAVCCVTLEMFKGAKQLIEVARELEAQNKAFARFFKPAPSERETILDFSEDDFPDFTILN